MHHPNAVEICLCNVLDGQEDDGRALRSPHARRHIPWHRRGVDVADARRPSHVRFTVHAFRQQMVRIV